MPAIITHYLCGQEVQKKFRIEEKTIIDKHQNVFNLGTQGPDFMFFYLGSGGKNKVNLPHVGEQMHTERTGRYIANALKYTRNAKKREMLSAYMFGFVTHYALDTNMHPYVFYKTGFQNLAEEKNKEDDIAHRLFETTLDCLFSLELTAQTYDNIKVYKQIRVSFTDAIEIAKMHKFAILTTYNIRIPLSKIVKAIADISFVYQFFYSKDANGKQRKFVFNLEKFLSIKHLYSAMVHSKLLPVSKSFLSEKTEWKLPWDDAIILKDSPKMLFQKGVSEAVSFIEIVFDNVLHNKQNLKKLGNRNYSTGLNCTEEKVCTCFDQSFQQKLLQRLI